MEPRWSRSSLCTIGPELMDLSMEIIFLSLSVYRYTAGANWDGLPSEDISRFLLDLLEQTSLREPGNCQLSGSKVSNSSSYPTRLRLGNPKPRLFHRTLILRNSHNSHNSRGDCGMDCGRRRWRRQLISLRSYLVMSLDYSLGWDVLVSDSSGT